MALAGALAATTLRHGLRYDTGPRCGRIQQGAWTAGRDDDSGRDLVNIALQELSGFTALQLFLGLGEVLGEQNGHD